MFELTIPSPTENQLRQYSSQFFSKWNFPNCVGAIDGKHVRINTLKRSGSLYFNYKEYYSIVLLAVVDADCKFIAVDIGSYGREGDAGIYLKSQIGKMIKNNKFNIPSPKVISGTNDVVPHVIVGDEAFALHENLMKPYPRQQSTHDQSKAVYNYRLSRARRTTENTNNFMRQHIRTEKHVKSAKRQKDQVQRKSQQLLTNQPTKSDFNKDLCEAMVAANIPFNKFSNTIFRSFLEKYTGKSIPFEATLRKGYIDDIYNQVMDKIKIEIGNNQIWVSVDETCDVQGRCVANVIVGILKPDYVGHSFLLHSEELTKTNHNTICKVFNKAMTILWPGDIM
ncbi:hypothetical protein QTP88_000488 [Uroleucon formosanum]